MSAADWELTLILFLIIPRSGGDLSFRSNPSLPGRKSATTDCSSLSGIEHRWEFTVFPENATYTPRPITLLGASGIPPPLTFSSSMITFSRLSAQGSSPLISRVVVSPVSSGLNGTVVNCFEGSISTDPVATTTIQIINPHQFGKTLIFCAIIILLLC